jgi:DNA polymerase/3'-5' exonuclease PolX
MLYEKLGIKDLKGLAKAARSGKIRTLPGFGTKFKKFNPHSQGFY